MLARAESKPELTRWDRHRGAVNTPLSQDQARRGAGVATTPARVCVASSARMIPELRAERRLVVADG